MPSMWWRNSGQMNALPAYADSTWNHASSPTRRRQTSPSSSTLSNEQTAVVPRVAHTWWLYRWESNKVHLNSAQLIARRIERYADAKLTNFIGYVVWLGQWFIHWTDSCQNKAGQWRHSVSLAAVCRIAQTVELLSNVTAQLQPSLWHQRGYLSTRSREMM